MNPADTMSEGMDPENIHTGMLIVGHRDSSLATSGSDEWVRTPNNIPILMNAPYETSSSTNLVSRVMSPNTLARLSGHSGGANRQMIAQGVNQPLIAGIQLPCMGCAQYMTDTPVCVQCGRWGHVQCLGIQHVMGYPFCGDCFQEGQRAADHASSQQHEMNCLLYTSPSPRDS